MSALKILIVENELLIAEQIALKITEAGYEVTGKATTGIEAITMAASQQPDLIIMDINLDGTIDGIEAARVIKKESGIPFIYLTDLDDQETIGRAQMTEPAAYLVKPFSERQIIASIHQALSNTSHLKPAAIADTEIPDDDQFIIKDALFIRLANSHFTKVLLNDITHMKAEGAYCEIYTTNGDKHTYSISLNHVHDKINVASFVRVHRSSVVNLDKVIALKGNLLIIGDTEIQIGETFKDSVLNHFPILK